MIICKKSYAFLLTIFFLITCCFFAKELFAEKNFTEKSAFKKPALTIFTWSQYIDPELVEKFENENGVELKFIYYETDEMRDEMIVSTNGNGYDIILVNGPSVEKYTKHNWLLPIEYKKITNVQYVDKKWREAFPSASTHAVPYLWGTLGIGYRKDKIKAIKKWIQLFRPDEKLHGKIMMIKDSTALIGASLKALGYSLNSIEPSEYEKAEMLLLSQKPFVRKYSYLTLSKDSALVTGDIWASMIYNGDALLLKEFEPNIEFVLPEEGGALWCDYLAISSSVKNREALAYRFINFIHDPGNNAKLAQFVYYATPNMKAEKLLPKEFLKDPVIYPDKNSLKNSESESKLPPGIIKIRNKIFSKVIR